jgi:hypothetical protein
MADPKVDLIFATPLISLRLDGAEEVNAQLLAAINERRRTDAGRRRSNAGG